MSQYSSLLAFEQADECKETQVVMAFGFVATSRETGQSAKHTKMYADYRNMLISCDGAKCLTAGTKNC